MFILAGVLGVLGAFAVLELIEILGFGDSILPDENHLALRIWLLIGGAFGGFLVQVVSWL